MLISSVLSLFVGVEVVSGYITVTGLKTNINPATGSRPHRFQIQDMKNNVPMFSLYIQALQRMADTPETDSQSWFQIAGIHGRPYYDWDFNKQVSGAPGIGYCTHGDVLFMAWHRPYLALFEQILAKHVQAIAKGYNSPTWSNAANAFRIPFFDWGRAPYTLPSWMFDSQIQITRPGGVITTWNPLYAYRFRRAPYPSTTFPSSDSLTQYIRTVRRPRNGASDPTAINNLLRAQGPGIGQQLYTVFSRSTSYNTMATQSSNGASFEGPHGWFHVTVGGTGHMTDVGYSAFDPIFMLHHANVDRLYVMWQAIHPNSWMSNSREPGGTRTLVPGQTINAATPLLPFHSKADGSAPFTANSARSLKAFGYSYPDVKEWEFHGANAAADLAKSVTARINSIYNVQGRSAKRSVPGHQSRGAVEREWTIEVSAPNAALAGASFSVMLFLGDKPKNPADWPYQTIGSMYVLAQPRSPLSGPMVAHTDVVITKFMQDHGIDTTDVKASKAFLDKMLTWGVQRADESVVPNEQFKGLDILVVDNVVKLPVDDTQLPKYLELTPHLDISPNITIKR